MGQRKHLIAQIERLNQKLWDEQSKLNKHKMYFSKLFHDNALPVVSALLAAFIAGWRNGRTSGRIQKIWKLSKFAAFTLIPTIKKI